MSSTAVKLKQTQNELDHLREEFQEFVYVVSHDLSGPLRHTSGFAEIILDNNADVLDAISKQQLDHIINAAMNSRDSLDLLGAYSRLNTDVQILENNISVAAILKDITIELETLIKTSNAQIDYGPLPVIKGDKKQLTLLFTQLIKNAVLYHVEGNAPVVKIEAETTLDRWQFSITDNGVGIPNETSEDMFAIFKRGVDKNDYPGAGMGLALAKKITQKHNGRIWLEPGLTQGTKLYFTLSRAL